MAAGTGGFELVERTLRRETFGTLSTVTENGRPHATARGLCGLPRDEPLILYVTTRTTTRKVRNIRAHPDVAFVVPVSRRLLPVFPLAPFSFKARRRWFHVRTMGRSERSTRHGFSAESW